MSMGTLFWIIFALIIYIYAGYPLLLYLIGMILDKKTRRRDFQPFVSILIPAYNEEALIKRKIDNTIALDYPNEKREIIIGSDGSTDRTDEIVKKYDKQGVRLFNGGRRMGKSALLMECVRIAIGDIILFTDADAVLEQDALKKILRNFADPKIGCVEGIRRDIDEKGLLLDSLYWRYETALKKLNSRLHSIVGATGAIFAIRKGLYHPLTPERGDDFEIPYGVLFQGYDTVLESEAVAYHPWLANEDEFKRIVRIVAWMLPSALRLLLEAFRKRRWIIVFQLLSHKILRWSVPIFMVLLFIINLNLHGGFYIIILMFQILFYIIAVVGLVCEKRKVRMIGFLKIPYFFCLINFASLVGIIKYCIGLHEMNWVKTAREEK